MRIAVFSDIHDNLTNLNKFLQWCRAEEIEALICCGDITNNETLAYLSKNCDREIYLVRGNIFLFAEKNIECFKNIRYFGVFGRFEIDGKRVGLCHEISFIDDVLKLGECDIVFYGHTHKPWIAEKHGAKLVNPGTLGGVFQQATFAVWDTKTMGLELIILYLIKQA